MNIANPATQGDEMNYSQMDSSEGVLTSKRIRSHYVDASRKDTSVESSHEGMDQSLAINNASEKSYNLSDETPYNSDLNRTVERIMEGSHEGITSKVSPGRPSLSLNEISDIFNKENRETEIVSSEYLPSFYDLANYVS